MKRDGIVVAGHIGTWYVIDEQNGLFLLEHEEFGDEAACVIVDAAGKLVQEDVWNGFDDLEDRYHRQSVEIIVDKEDILWEKLVARAEATGMTVEAVIDMLISVGAYGLMDKRLGLTEHEEWQLYTEYRNGEPVAYRYGPEWQAAALMVDGGYKTPEEAKLAWLREWEAQK